MSTEKQQSAVIPCEKSPSQNTKDITGVCLMTRIKITDPETGQVLLQMRGDE